MEDGDYPGLPKTINFGVGFQTSGVRFEPNNCRYK